MSRATDSLEATKLAEKLTREAVEIFYVNGDPDDPDISMLESSIALIAEAGNLPQELIDKSREAIAAEREATRCEMRGEKVPPIPPEKKLTPQENLPESNKGDDIIALIWGLFETAVRLDTQEKREQVLKSARYMADYLCLEEWITDTPCLVAEMPA